MPARNRSTIPLRVMIRVVAKFVVAVAVLVVVVAGRPPRSSAQALGAAPVQLPRISVESQSSVTIVGSSPSLRAVLEKLCEKTDVEFQSFRAEDRDVTVRYEELPLRRVLEGLLRNESFVLGFRGSADGEGPQVAWLQVIGTQSESASGSVTKAQGPRYPLPRLGFTSPDAAVRQRTADSLARRLHGDERQRKRFLDASDASYLEQLRDQPHARQFLTALRTSIESPEVRAKVNVLINRLR